MKRLKKIFLLSSSVLTLAAIPVIAGTFLVIKNNDNNTDVHSNNNFQTLAATTTAPVNFISQKNSDYVASVVTNSYFYSNANTLISYSYGGVQQYIITLVTTSLIINYQIFELNGSTFIAILTNTQELYIYNNSNPTTPTSTFSNINSQYNQIMYKNNFIFLYSNQFSTAVSNSYAKINMQTLALTIETIANTNLTNVFILKIIPLTNDYNVIIFANNPSSSENQITSTQTFNNISYLIVQNDFNNSTNVEGITNQPVALNNFSTTGGLTFSEINLKFISTDNNNIVIATPNAFLFVSNFSVNVNYISIPSQPSTANIISSVSMSKTGAFFTIVGLSQIYRLNYNGFNTTVFFNLPQISSSFNVSNLMDYSFISVDSNTSVILTNNLTQNYYGITLGDFTLLNVVPSFQVNLASGSILVNSTSLIPALSSSLIAANLIMSNRARPTSTQTFSIISVNYLSFNLSTGSCTVNISTAQVAWWSSTDITNSNVIITITNFQTIQDFLNGSTFWDNNNTFNSKLTNISSIQDITSSDIQNINPLDISSISQTNIDLIINPTVNYTFTVNTSNNSISVSAYVTYTNKLSNLTQTAISSNVYSITSIPAPVFTVFGASNTNNIISISQVIGSPNSLLPTNLADFLPSYIYRASEELSNVNSPSTINNIQLFYKNFISTNLAVDIVPQPDDSNGTLNIRYIFSHPFNGQSSITYQYIGFKKNSDFYSEFQGQSIANNSKIDVNNVSSISNDIKALSPYTLSTGNDLSSIINNNIEISNTVSDQNVVNQYLTSFINSNLNLMSFTPTIIDLSALTPESLVKAMQDGTLSLQMQYYGLTLALASSLGLTVLPTNSSIYVREITFTNFPTITELANISLNSSGADKVIDDYSSGVEINSAFEANVLKNIIIQGYNISILTSQNVNMKWNGDILNVEVNPPANQLISKWNVLPATYTFQMSWAAKNARILTIIASSIVVAVAVILIVLIIIAIWYYKKRTWLKKYF